MSLLKIDVEGWEQQVLAGARRTLKHPARRRIIEVMRAAGFDHVHSVGELLGRQDLQVAFERR